MLDFKTIILNELNSIDWVYVKNSNGSYDPYAIYKGGRCDISTVFHKTFSKALIRWRDERMTNWKGWVTTGTIVTPAGVSSPYVGTSTCSILNNPKDTTLEYDMINAFRMDDPNMRFQHLNVFNAIKDWLSASILTIFMDGSMNLTVNVSSVNINAYMLTTYAPVMEGEIYSSSQREGYSKNDYWDIFGKYLDLALTSSVQTPISMAGTFGPNTFTGVCSPVL